MCMYAFDSAGQSKAPLNANYQEKQYTYIDIPILCSELAAQRKQNNKMKKKQSNWIN